MLGERLDDDDDDDDDDDGVSLLYTVDGRNPAPVDMENPALLRATAHAADPWSVPGAGGYRIEEFFCPMAIHAHIDRHITYIIGIYILASRTRARSVGRKFNLRVPGAESNASTRRQMAKRAQPRGGMWQAEPL